MQVVHLAGFLFHFGLSVLNCTVH